MPYYLLLVAAAALYALSFFFNKKVEDHCQASLNTTVLFLLVTQLLVMAAMLLLLQGRLQFTPFSMICAGIQALLLASFTFLNLKTLAIVEVAKYSLYTMLGGMLVPSLYGILFAHEGINILKLLCYLLVTAALVLESRSGRTGKKGLLYLFAVFLVNGLFGVLSSVHQTSSLAHVGTLEYMLLQALLLSLAAAVFLLIRRLSGGPFAVIRRKRAWLYMLVYGAVYYGAELILLYAIQYVPASVQYPMITGGTLVFSTLIGMVTGESRQLHRLIPLGLSVAGTVLLVF